MTGQTRFRCGIGAAADQLSCLRQPTDNANGLYIENRSRAIHVSQSLQRAHTIKREREKQTCMSSFDPPPPLSSKKTSGGRPLRARSSFVCFAHSKKDDFPGKREEQLLQLVAPAWNSLSDRDRAEWDEVARQDKLRFLREREQCKASVIAPKRRAKKDPNAPRRPMSAFLAFSQARRSEVRKLNPSLDNTDISKLLGSIWSTEPMSTKAQFIEAEKIQRAHYKEEMRKFRLQQPSPSTTEEQDPATGNKGSASAFEHYRGKRQVFRSYAGRHPSDNASDTRSHRAQYPFRHVDQPVFSSHKVTPETKLVAVKPYSYQNVVTAPPSFGSANLVDDREIQRAGSDVTRFDALYAGMFGESFAEDDPIQSNSKNSDKRQATSQYFADVFQHQYP